MPIGEVLEKALKYPWKQKSLWFYGVLLAIFTAGSSATNQYEAKDGDFAFLNNIDTGSLIIGAVIVGLIVFVVSILGIVIASWSQVAICKGAVLVDSGKNITRKEIGKTGKRPVWRLIVLDVLIPILIAILLLITIGALVALFYFMPQPVGMWVGIAFAVFAIFALIPVAVYWCFVWVLASRYVALEDMKAMQSLGEARRLIKGKFWWTFLLGAAQGMISGLASFVALLPLIFLAGIAIFMVGMKIYVGAGIAGALALAYFLIYVVVVGYFVAFEQTGWTIWWLKLKEQKKAIAVKAPKKIVTKKAASAKKTAK